jgi:RNA polymerase sigma-70 factor (ECF subfamily)
MLPSPCALTPINAAAHIPQPWAAARPPAVGPARPQLGVVETTPVVTDAALVRAARDGDRNAFGQLVHRHLRAAHSAALAVLGSSADAEDVSQDAFLTALERLDDCRPAEKFRPWLLTIVRNRAIDVRRRLQVRAAESLDNAEGQGAVSVERTDTATPGPLWHTEQADTRAHLMAAIASLTDVRQEVLLLHDLEGWTHPEIAAHLGIAVGTVRAHLFWARRDVRARLSPELRGGTDDNP